MKKLLLTSILFLIIFSLKAQPTIEWAKSYGTNKDEKAYSIQETFDNGFIVVGSRAAPSSSIWWYKLSSLGSIEPKIQIFGDGSDVGYSVQQTSDSNYIVASSTNSSNGGSLINHGLLDFRITKMGSTSTPIFDISIGGPHNDIPYSIEQTNDNGFIVVGLSQASGGDVSGNHGLQDYWVVKLNSLGSIEWQKSLGGSFNFEVGRSIHQTIDGGYIIAGYASSNDGDVTNNHGSHDYWIVKLSSTGSLVWQKSFGGSSSDMAYCIQETIDGGYIVAGMSSSNDGDLDGNEGFNGYWIVKLNNLGVIQWQNSYGGSGSDWATSIDQTLDGGYIIAGYSNSTDIHVTNNHGGYDYWLVKINNNGIMEWQKTLGGTGDDYAQSVQQTTDGGYIVAGYSNSTDGDINDNHGNYDFWVVKLSPDPVNITELEKENLFNVYPNPAANQISVKSNIKLIGKNYSIFDNMGKTVLSGIIKNENTLIELSNLSSGIYLFTVDDIQETFKVIKE